MANFMTAWLIWCRSVHGHRERLCRYMALKTNGEICYIRLPVTRTRIGQLCWNLISWWNYWSPLARGREIAKIHFRSNQDGGRPQILFCSRLAASRLPHPNAAGQSTTCSWDSVSPRSHRPYDQIAAYVRPVEQPDRKGSQINHATIIVVDGLTIEISRKQVIEHVQKPVATISDRRRSRTDLT